MATAGDILVSESSLSSGEAQLLLLNIVGNGGGGGTIVQGPEVFIADIRGLQTEIEMTALEVEVDLLITLDVEVDILEIDVNIEKGIDGEFNGS